MQANVARLRDQERWTTKHALAHHEFHASAALEAPRTPDEENQKSSLSLTSVKHSRTDF